MIDIPAGKIVGIGHLDTTPLEINISHGAIVPLSFYTVDTGSIHSKNHIVVASDDKREASVAVGCHLGRPSTLHVTATEGYNIHFQPLKTWMTIPTQRECQPPCDPTGLRASGR